MEPLCQFQHLNIQACWPTSDCDFYRYARQVTPRGRQGRAPRASGESVPETLYDRLSSLATLSLKTEVGACPHGVLQVCLLAMEPFERCKDNELGDMRWN